MADDSPVHGKISAPVGEPPPAKQPPEPDAGPPKQRWAGRVASVVIVLVTVVLAMMVLAETSRHPRTDDAEVFANYIGIPPVVSGPITEIDVHDNQFVHAGLPLNSLPLVGRLTVSAVFVLSAGSNYSLSGAFASLVISALPTWDRPYSVNTKIALTLYLSFTFVIGSLSGLVVEAVYRSFYTTHPILSGLSDRLRVSAAMLTAAANGCEPGKDDGAKLRQYAMTGPSALRRYLIRSAQSTNVRARVSGAIALNDRLVQLCAAALDNAYLRAMQNAEEAHRLGAVAAAVRARAAELLTLPGIAGIGTATGTSTLPRWTPSDAPSDAVPTLPEIERIVASFGQILDSFEDASAKRDGAHQEHGTLAQRDPGPRMKLWKPDAFTSRGHLIFALRGALAATLCYLIYNGVNWPGLQPRF